MNSILRILSATAIVCGLLGCGTPMQLYPSPFVPSSKVNEGLEKYVQLADKKAFAAAPNQHYGYGYAADETNQAVRTAFMYCQEMSNQACRLLDNNGQPYEQEYLRFGFESKKILDLIEPPTAIYYALEGIDWLVKAPTALRMQAEGYHAPTPMTLTGITTIQTRELVTLLKTGQITLIDARGVYDEPLETIPGSYLIDWAGTEEGPKGNREQTLRGNFMRVMQGLQPDKSKAVGVFCFSAECWLSVNAALRLQTMGYTKIFWYRGGVEAWKAAKLPLLNAVPYATIWSR